MRCIVCNSAMSCQHETYHYRECGLDGVIIGNIEVCRCQCGEEIVTIPRMTELNRLIGYQLIKKPALLNGKEIRFLRKNIGLSGKQLAEYLGIDNATISRWENGTQRISPSNDRLLRMVYCGLKGIPVKDIKHLLENFKGINPKSIKKQKYTIDLHTSCENPTICAVPA